MIYFIIIIVLLLFVITVTRETDQRTTECTTLKASDLSLVKFMQKIPKYTHREG